METMGIEAGEGSTSAHFLTSRGMMLEFVSFPNGRNYMENRDQLVVVSGERRCLNETKERIVPEDLFRPSLEGAHHYAYVVENIEATVERLAEQLGAGPFFLVENVPLENITSRGEPAEFVHHSAFGYCGGGSYERLVKRAREDSKLRPAD
jgi:hypothetical protein